LVFASGLLSSGATVSAGGPVGLFGSGLMQTGAVSASGPITLDADTGLLSIAAPVTSTSGAQVSLNAGTMDITDAVNNPTGNVVITNTSGGPVTLGGGLAGFGLSDTELNKIHASSLTFNASPVTVDAPVNLTTVGSFTLNATSLDVNHSFVVAGGLDINCTGDVNVAASSVPVLLSGSTVNIFAKNISVIGGSASGASAGIYSTLGDLKLTMPVTGKLSFVEGNAPGTTASVNSAGNLTVTTGTCELCTGNLNAAGALALTETFPILVVQTSQVIQEQQQILVNSVNSSTDNAMVEDAVSDPGMTLKAPLLTGTGTPQLGSAGATAEPLKTDPNGVVGGETGTFGSGTALGDTGTADGTGTGGTTASSGPSGGTQQGNAKEEEEKKKQESARTEGVDGAKDEKPKAKAKPAMCS
ncbi:MAG: hypothetical protein ABMA01_22560, partial [Chthoniobacteraceae bacterium]